MPPYSVAPLGAPAVLILAFRGDFSLDIPVLFRFKDGVRILDDLIAELGEVCSSFEDKRRGRNGRYTMADIGLSAFSVFFMQSPSFLAHQKALEARRCSRMASLGL